MPSPALCECRWCGPAAGVLGDCRCGCAAGATTLGTGMAGVNVNDANSTAQPTPATSVVVTTIRKLLRRVLEERSAVEAIQPLVHTIADADDQAEYGNRVLSLNVLFGCTGRSPGCKQRKEESEGKSKGNYGKGHHVTMKQEHPYRNERHGEDGSEDASHVEPLQVGSEFVQAGHDAAYDRLSDVARYGSHRSHSDDGEDDRGRALRHEVLIARSQAASHLQNAAELTRHWRRSRLPERHVHTRRPRQSSDALGGKDTADYTPIRGAA